LIDPRWQIIAYLLAAFLLRVVAARLIASRPGAPIWVCRLTAGPPAVMSRFAYYVGLPYVTLVLGVLPGRYLGLAGLERLGSLADTPGAGHPLEWLRAAFSLLLQAWLPDLGRLVGLSVLMAVLLAVTWLLYRYHAARLGPGNAGRQLGPGNVDEVPALSGERQLRIEGAGHQPNPATFSRTAYAALHWAFYRAAFWLLTDDLYLAVVGGVILVLVEVWLCCEMDARAAVDISLLVTTATVFYCAPNLWLLIPVHWLLARMCRRIVMGVSMLPTPAKRWSIES
jgi:hypothetical protein